MGESDRLKELDEATLTEHPYRALVEVEALLPEDAEPNEWEAHLEMFAEDKFSDLACVVDVDVYDREEDADGDEIVSCWVTDFGPIGSDTERFSGDYPRGQESNENSEVQIAWWTAGA